MCEVETAMKEGDVSDVPDAAMRELRGVIELWKRIVPDSVQEKLCKRDIEGRAGLHHISVNISIAWLAGLTGAM
jgi:hypothetical protein